MAINTQKVLIGGIVAGVVMNAIDILSKMFILGARMKAESDAFKPGLADQMSKGSAMISYIVMDFVLGILLVWTYAAIRPRFGPGPGLLAGGRSVVFEQGDVEPHLQPPGDPGQDVSRCEAPVTAQIPVEEVVGIVELLLDRL